MFREGLRPPDPFREKEPLEAAVTQDGMSIDALSRLAPVVLVCLPSLPCDKLLAALAKQRPSIEAAGARLALAHFDGDASALVPHDLDYVARIADPERRLYAHFELGTVRSFFKTVQLPGAFVVVEGEATVAWRPASLRAVPGPLHGVT
ncbi:MAG: hypothetical protein OER88_03820 [Planctomycetota bacterium]|nr:hypothetical protein [Planctomycetota bacterium]